MEHIRHISRCGRVETCTPRKAAVWQDIICYKNHALAELLTIMGGASPMVTFLDQKCDLPQPNDTT